MSFSPIASIPFLGLFARRLFGVALLGGVSALACGCADIVTYAGESRQTGITHYNAGEYPEAAGAFANAIKQRPQDFESYYYMGRTYEAMKNYHQAVGQYRTSLTLMDNALAGKVEPAFRAKAIEGLASSLALGNDATLEAAAFSRTNGPTTAEDHFVLAKVRRIHGDVDMALQEYHQAAELDPKSIAIAKEYGLYLMQLNQRTPGALALKRAWVLNYRARNEADPQVEQALRAANIVPGPSLADQNDLVRPLIPPGPLPEVDLGQANGR